MSSDTFSGSLGYKNGNMDAFGVSILGVKFACGGVGW